MKGMMEGRTDARALQRRGEMLRTMGEIMMKHGKMMEAEPRPAALTDLEPGWSVGVTTRHEGEREVAEIVRVVFER
jgi:hypothetical protein